MQLRNQETNQTRLARTDEGGFFRQTELPVGDYEVLLHQPGFAPYVQSGLVLALGQTVDLTIELVPAGVVESVKVTADLPVLDPSQTASVTRISTTKIAELPVRTRNYLHFVLLAPGVAGTHQPPHTGGRGSLADSGFTFGGLRPRSK